jgi:hypothetical protein
VTEQNVRTGTKNALFAQGRGSCSARNIKDIPARLNNKSKQMPQKPKSEKTKRGYKLDTASDLSSDAGLMADSFNDLGDLPRSYGVDTIFLVAQEPHWLFTYWDIDITKHPGGAAFLRYYLGSGELEGEIEVLFESRNWYIPIEQSATDYYVELGFHRGNKWNPIARSTTVTTPPEKVTDVETFDYATIPFHLSFQRLIEKVESATKSGEDLLSALSRLQKDGDFSAFGSIGFFDLLSEDQRTLLGAVLGPDVAGGISSEGLSSSELEARIRSYLDEHIGSGGARELLSSFQDMSALFSGGPLSSAGSLSSETLTSSWGVAELASWVTAVTSSWTTSSGASWGAGAGAAGPETLSSSLTSWGQSALSSWAQAELASWGQAAGSSWGAAGGESSGSLVAISSWLAAAQSSWAEAALSSWSTPEMTIWFSAESVTSWSGASESLSSFGDRGFFMHVNAEVIFYGGTDPRAKVTINGHPVVLNPDGTFRYHFIFPNADYKIDIVAESPDGVETRSAALDFLRATGKTGHVTDTPQPPLGEPMGRTVT